MTKIPVSFVIDTEEHSELVKALNINKSNKSHYIRELLKDGLKYREQQNSKDNIDSDELAEKIAQKIQINGNFYPTESINDYEEENTIDNSQKEEIINNILNN